MKIKFSFLIIALIFGLFSAHGLTAKSFLWEVETGGVKSYILGSIHMLKKSAFPLKKELENSFMTCNFLVVEADISAKNMGEIFKVTMDKAGYKDGSKLSDHISADTMELAKARLDKLNMSIDYFEKFKPWFLAMSITSMELMKLGFDPNMGVDKYFINKSGEKKILELEGIPFQIGIFDSFSDKENDMFLRSSLSEADSLGENVDSMVKAWQEGDVEGLTKMVTENRNKEKELVDIFKIIIDDRNVTMTGKIEKWLKNGGSYFIIVGSAHLVGENGIINLLKKKGFELKQL
ncbi:MAG: TraB/GumN family protein [Acidobacteriota bacterium]